MGVSLHFAEGTAVTLTASHAVVAARSGRPWYAFEASEIEQGGHSVVSVDQTLFSQSFDVIEKVVKTTVRTAAIEIELEDAAAAILIGCTGGKFLAVYGVLPCGPANFETVERNTFLDIPSQENAAALRLSSSAPDLRQPLVWPAPLDGHGAFIGRNISIGSQGHDAGQCKPCRWEQRRPGACQRGAQCLFCHQAHRSRRRPRGTPASSVVQQQEERFELTDGTALACSGKDYP